MYWLHKGNLDEITQVLSAFKDEILITSRSQVKRLRLLCRNDAFMNAFASAHIAADILSLGMEEALGEAFSVFARR